MAAIKQILESTHDDLRAATSLMLDRYAAEIFDICYCLSELAEQVDKNGISSVPLGLYAVNYYLAAVAYNIGKITLTVAAHLKKKPRTNKLLKCQELIAGFADALIKECHNPLLHVSSQITVLLDYSDIDCDVHTRLTFQSERIGELMEELYDLAGQFECHPVLKIKLSLVK
jgi:hypothetical protein